MEYNSLYHHGILGQKWGVRRFRNADGTLTAAGRRRQSKLDEKAEIKDRKIASKKRRTLSDDELNKRVGRLEREKRLRQLTEEDINPGKTRAKAILSDIGNKTVRTVATGATLYTAKVLVSKYFGSEAGNAVYMGGPKKK